MPQILETDPQNLASGDEDTLRRFRPSLDGVVTSRILPYVPVEKVSQYALLRRNDAFWRGAQYSTPGFLFQGGAATVPVGDTASISSPDVVDEEEAFLDAYNTNIYRSNLRKLIAVIGGRAPNVNGEPRIKDDDLHISRARLAQKVANLYYDIWDSRRLQRRLALSGAKNGTTFLYTPWVVDGVRYGYSDIPVQEAASVTVGPGSFTCPECGQEGSEEELPGAPICPNCGSDLPPESLHEGISIDSISQQGSQQYPSGNVEIFLESGLTVTTPFDIMDLPQAEWLRYEFETSPGSLYREFPELRKMSAPTGGSSISHSGDIGRYTRDQLRSFDSAQHYGRYGRWLMTTFWWRPLMYEYIVDEEVREFFKTNYPEGSRHVSVNGFLLRVVPERMDDVWAVMVPEEHETMWPSPYMDESIQFNEQISTALNIAVSAAERSVAFNLYDPNVIDGRVANRLGRRFAEWLPANPGSAGNLKEGIRQINPSEMRPEHLQLAQVLREFDRDISGITEILFGGGPPHATLGEAELKRGQALMMLGPFWDATRRVWERAMQNAVLQFARHSDGNFYVPRETGGEEAIPISEDLGQLLEGGWLFHADESMPMTAGQRRAYLLSLLQTVPPELIDQMQLFHPSNANVFADILAMPGGEGWQSKMRTALLDVMRRLAAEEPTFEPDPFTGDLVPAPSIPPDKFLFDPAIASAVVPEWLLTPGADRPPEGSPGWQNVYLYGRAYFDMMQPPPPPEQDGGPPDQGPNAAPAPPSGETRLQDIERVPESSAPLPPENGVARPPVM